MDWSDRDCGLSDLEPSELALMRGLSVPLPPLEEELERDILCRGDVLSTFFLGGEVT